MSNQGNDFQFLRQIFAGIFLLGVLGFSVYQGKTFWGMWKKRHEHTRVTEKKKQNDEVKKNVSAEENKIAAQGQQMSVAPPAEVDSRTKQNKFRERPEKKNTRRNIVRKRPQKGTFSRSTVQPDKRASGTSDVSRMQARCRKNLVNWGRQWFIALRRGLPGNELWKDKIFCPTGKACLLGSWKNYKSRPDKRKYMILFYCPAHNWAFCGDGKIRKCKEKKQ